MRSVRRKIVASAFAAVFSVAVGLSTGAGAQAQELPGCSDIRSVLAESGLLATGSSSDAVVTACVHAAFAAHGIPGAQVVYADNNDRKEFDYGVASTATGTPVTPQTVFEAASLTKVVATYVVLQLVDEGILDLDRPLSEYFDYPRIAGDPAAGRITARMVLTHTTGLPNWAIGPSSADFDTTPVATTFEPGTQWSYSGEGFYYLQKTVESLTGTPFVTLAEQRVFDRFGMTSSDLLSDPAFDAVSAVGHRSDGTAVPLRSFAKANIAYTLRTTATDYSKFLRGALLAGEGLAPATRDAMFTASGSADHGGSDRVAIDHIKWGLGIGLQKNELGDAIWHWGDNGPFKAFFLAYPATGRSVVIMTNSESGLEAVDDIAGEFFGRSTVYATDWIKEAE